MISLANETQIVSQKNVQNEDYERSSVGPASVKALSR